MSDHIISYLSKAVQQWKDQIQNCKVKMELHISYKVCKLIRFPSSGGRTPENWFASSILFWIFVVKKRRSLERMKSKGTYTMKSSRCQYIYICIHTCVCLYASVYICIYKRTRSKVETYRYLRVVIFPRCSGIFPDKRFTRRELHNICNM